MAKEPKEHFLFALEMNSVVGDTYSGRCVQTLMPFSRNSCSRIAVMMLLCAVNQGFGQGTPIQITFDGPPLIAPGTAKFVQHYYESNMWFRPLGVVEPGNGFGRRGRPLSDGPAYSPDNGTAYIQGAAGDSLVFSLLDGSTFNLLSVDLAEYSSVVPVFAVPFVGYRLDGSTVVTNLTPDGIIDGTGPLANV